MSTKKRCIVRVGFCLPYRNPETGDTINETLRFTGVAKSDGPYLEDGSDESHSFWKQSPSADFSILVANPALFGKFSAGNAIDVDFTSAE